MSSNSANTSNTINGSSASNAVNSPNASNGPIDMSTRQPHSRSVTSRVNGETIRIPDHVRSEDISSYVRFIEDLDGEQRASLAQIDEVIIIDDDDEENALVIDEPANPPARSADQLVIERDWFDSEDEDAQLEDYSSAGSEDEAEISGVEVEVETTAAPRNESVISNEDRQRLRDSIQRAIQAIDNRPDVSRALQQVSRSDNFERRVAEALGQARRQIPNARVSPRVVTNIVYRPQSRLRAGAPDYVPRRNPEELPPVVVPQPPHEGLPPQQFVEYNRMSGLLNTIQCQACFDVARKPMFIKGCIHTFCEHCIFQYFAARRNNSEIPRNRRQLYACAVCRHEGPDIAPHTIANEILDSFEFCCKNVDYGCQAKLKYASMVEHQNECQETGERPWKCEDCSLEMQVKDRREHHCILLLKRRCDVLEKGIEEERKKLRVAAHRTDLLFCAFASSSERAEILFDKVSTLETHLRCFLSGRQLQEANTSRRQEAIDDYMSFTAAVDRSTKLMAKSEDKFMGVVHYVLANTAHKYFNSGETRYRAFRPYTIHPQLGLSPKDIPELMMRPMPPTRLPNPNAGFVTTDQVAAASQSNARQEVYSRMHPNGLETGFDTVF